ncbi:MAG: TonB-dependent receptor, partial [bacterium]
MKKAGVVLILLMVLNFAANAQPEGRCVISGYISDAATGEAIAGANLKIEDEPYGAAANLYGFYSIPTVPTGIYTLNISAIGYETITREIVCAGEPIRMDIELEPKAIVGEEVVIEARRVGGMDDPYVGHSIVEQDIILRSPGFLEADLFRTLQTMTGVLSISDYSSGLYIWGSTPSGNMVLLDNIEVYNPSHLFGLTSSFIADAIREANLVKGGYPAKWGGRLGSVLEITNKDGNRKEFDGMAELSLMSGQLLLEGPVGNGSFMAAGRRTWIDLATGLMAEGDLIDEKLPYSFYDLQTRINQEISPRDRLTLSFYTGDDVLHFEDDDEDEFNDDFEYRWGNVTTSLQWKHIFHDRLFGHMVFAGSRFRAKFKTGDGFYDRLNTIGDVTAKGDLTYFHSKEHTLSFGGMLKWREIRNNDKILVEDWDWEADTAIERIEEWDDYTNASLIALYAEEEYKPNALWKFQLGLRSEFAFNGNYFRVGPRFSAQRMIDEKTTLRLATGQYYQYIHLYNPAEDDGMAFLDFWIPVDENVKPGSAQHFVLGFDTDHLPMALSANVYYKNMTNLLANRESFVLILEDNIRTQFYVGKGRAAGFDVSLDGEWGD